MMRLTSLSYKTLIMLFSILICITESSAQFLCSFLPFLCRLNDANGCCIERSYNKERLYDSIGNPYGRFKATTTFEGNPINITIIYNRQGLTSDYKKDKCGNKIPTKPASIGPGYLAWNEIIDYGSCVNKFLVTENKPAGSNSWIQEYYNAGSTNSNGKIYFVHGCLPCNKL